MNRLGMWLVMGMCCAVWPARAQTTKEAFVSLPESLSADLGAYARMDLIDLYNAGLPAAVENAFGDTLRLEQLTPDYLRLNTGKGSLQLVLLRMVNDSQLYCLIRTACGPVCDSRISFYSPSWNRLPAETFLAPEPPVFSTEENVPLPASVETFTEWGYDPASAVLRQTGQSTEALPPEEGQGPRMLTEVREYRWTGMRFE